MASFSGLARPNANISARLSKPFPFAPMITYGAKTRLAIGSEFTDVERHRLRRVSGEDQPARHQQDRVAVGFGLNPRGADRAARARTVVDDDRFAENGFQCSATSRPSASEVAPGANGTTR